MIVNVITLGRGKAPRMNSFSWLFLLVSCPNYFRLVWGRGQVHHHCIFCWTNFYFKFEINVREGMWKEISASIFVSIGLIGQPLWSNSRWFIGFIQLKTKKPQEWFFHQTGRDWKFWSFYVFYLYKLPSLTLSSQK